MSRGKFSFVLAIAAFACVLATAFSYEVEEDDPKPYGYKEDTKPYGYKDDTKPYGYKDDSKPYGYKDDTKPYGYKDDTKPYGYKDDTKPYGYKDDDGKDDKDDWEEDKHGWKYDKHDWKDEKHGWKDEKSAHHEQDKEQWEIEVRHTEFEKPGYHEHDKEKWKIEVRHTEFLVCQHCGENSALMNAVMLNTFNVVKEYGISLDLALCITLHVVYFILLVLDKLCEQNLHSMVDGVGRLIRTAMANPTLAKTIQKSGLKTLNLFRCSTDHLHKSLIF